MLFDIYYKKRYNLASSYPDDNEQFRFENGSATGLEVLLKYNSKVESWVGYSYSRSIKGFENNYYLSQYDRTHIFKINFNYPILDNWILTAFFNYSTGLPFTPSNGKFIGLQITDFQNDQMSSADYKWRSIPGTKNSFRMSDYHRLDIGITGSFLWNKYLVKPYLQIMNVYNSENPFFYNFSPYTSNHIEDDSRGSFVTPTLGVSVEF